jgi:hypothetical protein
MDNQTVPDLRAALQEAIDRLDQISELLNGASDSGKKYRAYCVAYSGDLQSFHDGESTEIRKVRTE